MNQADSYKLLTAELKTENRDLKSSLADMQRSLIKYKKIDEGGNASNDTLIEMRKLV